MRPNLLMAALALSAGITLVAHAARPALEDAEHCAAEAFHGRHQACFDREERKLPSELRNRWAKVLKIIRMRMALLDQQGADVSAEEEQISKVENCSDEAFHRQHTLCFDREIMKVPAEQREKHLLPEHRALMVQQDQSDQAADELLAKLDRRAAEAKTTNKPVVVFGMTLGKSFTVPVCVPIDAVGRPGDATCSWRPKLSLMGMQVFLSSSIKPTWVKSPYEHQEHNEVAAALDVEVIGRNLEAVHIPTIGVRFQDVIVAALKEKFGQPKSTETVIKQNAFGAKFEVAIISWEVSGVKILFDGGDLEWHGSANDWQITVLEKGVISPEILVYLQLILSQLNFRHNGPLSGRPRAFHKGKASGRVLLTFRQSISKEIYSAHLVAVIAWPDIPYTKRFPRL